MKDFVITTGDMISITVPPPAIVPQLLAPVPLVGSGTQVLVNNQPVCLLGDELPAAIAGPLAYTAPPYVTPGTGTLSIILNPSNVTVQASTGKPILIRDGPFQAVFTVGAPAMMPTPAGPQPDPLMVKPGTAQFITTNVIVQAG
jgi:hypothetical protein